MVKILTFDREPTHQPVTPESDRLEGPVDLAGSGKQTVASVEIVEALEEALEQDRENYLRRHPHTD